MNHRDNSELGARVLPSVDLTLWVQLVLAALLLVAAGSLAVSAA
jgi:hypothetical protein